MGAWDNGINNKTAVPNANSLATGAPTTYETFIKALDACNSTVCDVYFNFHVSLTVHKVPKHPKARFCHKAD